MTVNEEGAKMAEERFEGAPKVRTISFLSMSMPFPTLVYIIISDVILMDCSAAASSMAVWL